MKKWKRFFPLLLIASFIAVLASSAYGFSVPRPPAKGGYKPQPAFLDSIIPGGKAPQQQAASVYEIHDEATFAEKTKVFHMMPFNDPSIEFEISVPEEWEKKTFETQNLNIDRDLVGAVATFTSPFMGVYQATITVRTALLDEEISAENWLKNYILSSGFAIDGDFVEKDQRRAAVYYAALKNSQDIHAYVSAQINGRQIVVAQFEAPIQLQDYISFLQKRSVDSLRIVYPSKDPIEQQKIFTMVDAVRLSYPTSWQNTPPNFKNLDRLTVQLLNKNSSGATEGYINIIAIRRSPATNLTQEIENLKKHFQDVMKIQFTKMVSSAPAEATSRFLFKRYEIYEASYTKSGIMDPEVRLAVLGDKEWYIFVYLLTPQEKHNIFSWAHNIQSFDEVVKSMQ